MFQSLTEKLSNAFKFFRNKGKLSEADIKAGIREIKMALLEADVNYKVVKSFTNSISEKALGAKITESLLPGQEIVKIVRDELIAVMGSEAAKIEIAPNPPTIIMMVGLQGSGKTTHSGKLAKYFKDKGKSPLLVACDVYRPAAIDQLKVVGESVNVPVFSMGSNVSPVEIAKAGVQHAIKNSYNMVIIDTAGRLQIDESMMKELEQIKKCVNPNEILLVIDSMIGQESVNVAETFNNLLDISGVILTKLDGDARGGAALSVRYVTGKPIKFVGVGEKMDALDVFHPDRMASRILGMGDILSLIEKAENTIEEKKAEELAKKIKSSQFTLNDFLEQLHQVQKMGGIEKLLSMMPGNNQEMMKGAADEKQMKRTEAIVLSMTPEERENPDIINGSRRKRIAKGCGLAVEDVNRLLKQFDQMKKLMKQMAGANPSSMKRMKGMPLGKMKFPF